MSVPVSELSLTSVPVALPFLRSVLVTLLLRMSALRTLLFLMSPESTVFLPGSAIAVPESAASRAANATSIAGDGRRRGIRLNASPPCYGGFPILGASDTILRRQRTASVCKPHNAPDSPPHAPLPPSSMDRRPPRGATSKLPARSGRHSQPFA